ncbi:toll/interleukin-1 receptor domain-containing protein [Stratiformator vulcanicus]|uniref:TIR domain-containing protein n=1 Tax=Stratiformator vulcanicus TaxID=2527980 RepID=A0A517QWJ1_9PLAN|nr:toll/interleukin-1 receptor domain-containing protein [Stratiformator vulcanicus]QDT35957.1 hypothetical protein Pan189_03120 [Stratiformator vulcanicus]
MSKIFVSYRRKDAASETGRIVNDLVQRFGKKAVFNDVFDIRGGQRFREVIGDQLNATKVFLAVIGSHWVDAVDDQGLRRLDNPEDYVHFEIEAALSQPGCIVIPVLVNHQQIPKKEELPEALAELVDRNAVKIRPDPDFTDDMESLCQLIAEHVPPKKLWPKFVAAASVFLALMVAAFFLGLGPQIPDTIVQAFDSSTGERVLRPFALRVDDRAESPPAVQHLLVDTKPQDISITSVECRGFKSTVDSSKTNVAESDDGFLIKIALDRATNSDDCLDDIDYFEAIKPNVGSVLGWPTDEQIADDISDNDVPAKDVELIVQNMTQQHLDVLLFWLPPSNNPQLQNPFAARWTQIKQSETKSSIEPGKHARFKLFRLDPGYFVFFASANGTEARKLYSTALYKEPFVVATITELTEHGLSLKFYKIMPPEFSKP